MSASSFFSSVFYSTFSSNFNLALGLVDPRLREPIVSSMSMEGLLAFWCFWSKFSSKFQVALDVVFASVAYFVEYRSCASCVWNTASDFRCSSNNTLEVTSGALVLVIVVLQVHGRLLALWCFWSKFSSKFQVALDVVFTSVANFVEYRSCTSCVWNTASDFRCNSNNTLKVTSGAFVLVLVLVLKQVHGRALGILVFLVQLFFQVSGSIGCCLRIRSHILLNTARAQAVFGTRPVILDEAATTRSKLRVEHSSSSSSSSMSMAGLLALWCLWSKFSSKFQVALDVVFTSVANFVEYARAQAVFGTRPVILDVTATTRLKLRPEQSSGSAYEPTKIVARRTKQRKDFIFIYC